ECFSLLFTFPKLSILYKYLGTEPQQKTPWHFSFGRIRFMERAIWRKRSENLVTVAAWRNFKNGTST
ncbi:hypothetical protein L9F63_016411, partial [Diploptera punctata]